MPVSLRLRRTALVAILCGTLAAGLGAAVSLLVLGAGAARAAGTSSTPVATPPASNPFAPGIPTPQATTPTASTPTIQTVQSTTGGSDSAFSGGGIAAIAVGALLILGGIAFFIWYDARKRAPVRAMAGGPRTAQRTPGSKRAPKARKLSAAERRRRKRGRAR